MPCARTWPSSEATRCSGAGDDSGGRVDGDGPAGRFFSDRADRRTPVSWRMGQLGARRPVARTALPTLALIATLAASPAASQLKALRTDELQLVHYGTMRYLRASCRTLLRECARIPSPDLRLDTVGTGVDSPPRFLRSRQRRGVERPLELCARGGGAVQLCLRDHPRKRAPQLDAQPRAGARPGERHGGGARPAGAPALSAARSTRATSNPCRWSRAT